MLKNHGHIPDNNTVFISHGIKLLIVYELKLCLMCQLAQNKRQFSLLHSLLQSHRGCAKAWV